MPVTWRSKPDYMAECDCGWRFQGRNGLGVAGAHYKRCGQRLRVQSEAALYFDPDGSPGGNPAHPFNEGRQARANARRGA